MTFEILKPETYKKAQWRGGTTTELYIFPEGSSLQNLDFQFRISTATVEVEESTFTVFQGVSRIILPLKGTMTLVHDNGQPKRLKPFEQDVFSGESLTKCYGKVTDFNLMKRGSEQGTIEIIQLTVGEEIKLKLLNSVIYCFSGQLLFDNQLFSSHETLLNNTTEENTFAMKAITQSVLIKVDINSGT